MTTQITITTITFPEIRLPQRAAAQLRGFFGDYFRAHSVLLHNHYEDGRTLYRMPLVQYKVINGVPTLLGLQEGAQLLAELFFQIKTLRIEDREYSVMERDISLQKMEVGVVENLCNYRFVSPWMALNQRNYAAYRAADETERMAMLNRILRSHILSFYRGVGYEVPREQRILTTLRPHREGLTGFKDNLMTAISGEFTANVLLPNNIGLGKSVARGYGTISKI
jgi:hypothetical protein